MPDSALNEWLQTVVPLTGRDEELSAAERIAAVLRSRIIEGHLAPGVRLSEEAIATSLDVSRNSLREAFRLLSHDRLLRHEKNRGVFVCELGPADVVEIYSLRETLEIAALQQIREQDGSPDTSDLRAAVNAGLVSAVKQEWSEVGTANMRFHQALAGLAGSRRVDELMTQLMAELRLAFHVMQPIEDFHAPYLPDNVRICELVEEGSWERAVEAIRSYTQRSRKQLVSALERFIDGRPEPSP